MEFDGTVSNGVIVMDREELPAEGTRVRVIVPAPPTDDDDLTPLSKMLLSFAGRAVGMSADASEQHDHYIYGTPKR